MILRRNSGLIYLHRTLIALESALLWVILSHSGMRFSTLLPYWIYPSAIFLGVMLAGRNAIRAGLVWSSSPLNFYDSSRIAFRQIVFACAAVFTIVVLFKDPGISRFFLLVFFGVLAPLLAVLNRHQLRWINWRFFFDKKPVPTLFVGGTSRLPDFSSWMANQLQLGVVPVGHLTYHEQDLPIADVPRLGSFDDLGRVLAEKNISQVVMLDLPDTIADAEKLLGCCIAQGSRLIIHNNFGDRFGYALQMVSEDIHSFLSLHDEPLQEPINCGLKRTLDIVIACLVLVLVFPPLAILVAIMHRLQSPGPLFHAQMRTGHNQSCFLILKFRSMHEGPGDVDKQSNMDDNRVFRFARFLRRSSLDEIPQFINVLRGQMSTVGPRPHLLAHSRAFSRDLDVYPLRYFVKPGITGLAQCNGFRGLTSTPELLRKRVRLDLEYIRMWTLWLDVVIILKTVRQVIMPPSSAH